MWLLELSDIHLLTDENQFQHLSVRPWNGKTVTEALPGSWRVEGETQWRECWGRFPFYRKDTDRDEEGINWVSCLVPNWLGTLLWLWPCSVNRGAFLLEGRGKREQVNEQRKERQRQLKIDNTTLPGYWKEKQLRGWGPGANVSSRIHRARLTPWGLAGSPQALPQQRIVLFTENKLRVYIFGFNNNITCISVYYDVIWNWKVEFKLNFIFEK